MNMFLCVVVHLSVYSDLGGLCICECVSGGICVCLYVGVCVYMCVSIWMCAHPSGGVCCVYAYVCGCVSMRSVLFINKGPKLFFVYA